MSGPASRPARVRAQARFETRTLLRNGEQLLVSIVLPVGVLLALTYGPLSGPVSVATASALAVAVVSTAFTGQAIATAFDRRYGVLELLGVTPLGRDGLLAGKFAAVSLVVALQSAVLVLLGLILGNRVGLASWVPAAITLALGLLVFLSYALLMAGLLRPEAVLALANLLWVAFLGLGLAVPVSALPAPLAAVGAALPPGALGEAMRAALVDGAWPWAHWAVLAAWGVVGAVAALRWFRWSP